MLLYRASTDPARVGHAFGDRQLTFGELAERAETRAGGLQRRGVVEGDRVAIAMSVGLPLVEVFWALQLLGASPCVLNPTLPPETLARRAELVRPRLVVTDELAAQIACGGAPSGDPDLSGEHLAFLQLTSGTSGEPRASMIRH